MIELAPRKTYKRLPLFSGGLFTDDPARDLLDRTVKTDTGNMNVASGGVMLTIACWRTAQTSRGNRRHLSRLPDHGYVDRPGQQLASLFRRAHDVERATLARQTTARARLKRASACRHGCNYLLYLRNQLV